jgi:hypothetical protein
LHLIILECFYDNNGCYLKEVGDGGCSMYDGAGNAERCNSKNNGIGGM